MGFILLFLLIVFPYLFELFLIDIHTAKADSCGNIVIIEFSSKRACAVLVYDFLIITLIYFSAVHTVLVEFGMVKD